MLSQSKQGNLVVYVRYFELAVDLACSSYNLCTQVAKGLVAQVFSDFFDADMDMLTQVTLMDFVVKLSENETGVHLMNESSFVNKLFEHYGAPGNDQYGFVNSNMLLVASKLYSIQSSHFDPFSSENFMQMLRFYVCSDVDVDKPQLKDTGLQCLFFLFTRKQDCLQLHLVSKPENHCLLDSFLRVAMTTQIDLRNAFLKALT